jgi:3-oxoacyl-[acyl-carrier protein] reductase
MTPDSQIGRVALVTGASGGIGAAMVLGLAQDGYQVAVHYHRDQAAAQRIVDAIVAQHGIAWAVQGDLRSPDTGRLVINATLAHSKRLDTVVACAGVTADNLCATMTDEEWDVVFDINVRGTFSVVRAACKPMMLAKRGKIILVSSVAGAKGGRGQVNYAASKAALEGMTRALAVELSSRGILVNAVAPGVIDTPMSERVRSQAPEEVTRRILLGRAGTSDEVANVIRFLASDASSYMTGSVIAVDGGFKMA